MGGEAIPLTMAFVAGLLSFLSPCCLPLVPTYVTYLTGSSFDELAGGPLSTALRRRVITNSLAFIVGFSAIFIALGLGASAVGQFFRGNMDMIRQLSGIIVVAFGLYMMGLLQLPFLERDIKVERSPGRTGLLNSFLIGATFSAGWSPCVGPILAGILAVAAQSQNAYAGAMLLSSYSLGLAVPFFLTALSLNLFVRFFPRIGRHLPKIRFASGLLMVIIGLMIFTGTFTWLNQFFNYYPGI